MNQVVHTLHELQCPKEKMADAGYEMAARESTCVTSLYVAHLSLSLQKITTFFFLLSFIERTNWGINCLHTNVSLWLLAQCKRLSIYPSSVAVKVFDWSVFRRAKWYIILKLPYACCFWVWGNAGPCKETKPGISQLKYWKELICISTVLYLAYLMRLFLIQISLFGWIRYL